MFMIQSGSGEFSGQYLMGFIGALPVWTASSKEAWKYTSENEEEIVRDEQNLERHGHLCFIIPA